MKPQKTLMEQLEEDKEKIAKQLKLIADIPDLKKVGTRWSEYFCSETVKQKATDVHFCHSCGCCDDAVLYAMPYFTQEGFDIYYSKPQIGIGEKNAYGYGEREWNNWRKSLEGFPQAIIDKVEKYFLEHPEGRYDDDEEDSANE